MILLLNVMNICDYNIFNGEYVSIAYCKMQCSILTCYCWLKIFLRWQLNFCHGNILITKLASLVLATSEAGEKSNINIVKHNPSTRSSEGWVYEGVRIGLPEVMNTSQIALQNKITSLPKCGEKYEKSSFMVDESFVDIKLSGEDSISEHFICCNYCHELDCNTSNKTKSSFYLR